MIARTQPVWQGSARGGSGGGSTLLDGAPPPLPAGVTLQAIDGETMTSSTTMSHNYYAGRNLTFATSNASYPGLSWDAPTFFPVQCFYGVDAPNGQSDFTQFVNLGLNTSCAVFSTTDYTLFVPNQVYGLSAILTGNQPENIPNLAAWTVGVHLDEPGFVSDISATISTMTNATQDGRIYSTIGTHDSVTFGSLFTSSIDHTPIPYHTQWITNFPTPNSTTRRIDLFGVDVYWFAGSNNVDTGVPGNAANILSIPMNSASANATADQMCRGSNYGNMIDVFRSFGNGTNTGPGDGAFGQSGAPSLIPHVALVENCNGNLGGTPRSITPAEMNWAVWSSLIHGARSINYFFEQHLFAAFGTATQATATNRLIKQLAPVLNSPFAKGFCTAVSPHGYLFPIYEQNWLNGGIELCAKWYQGGNFINAGLLLVNGFYIFATTRYSETVTNVSATFTVARGTVANVVGESRSINIVAGQFTDTFANAWTVHIYQIG